MMAGAVPYNHRMWQMTPLILTLQYKAMMMITDHHNKYTVSVKLPMQGFKFIHSI